MEPRQNLFSLDLIDVASPCAVPWEQMQGDGAVRFCGACRLHVYNLSGMTRPEAEALVRQHEGHLCVRFFRRTDGTVLTQDCPVGWRALRRHVVRKLVAAASLVGALLFGSARATAGEEQRTRPLGWSAWIRCIRWLEGEPARPDMQLDGCTPPPLTIPKELLDTLKVPGPVLQGRIAYPTKPPSNLIFPPPPAPPKPPGPAGSEGR